MEFLKQLSTGSPARTSVLAGLMLVAVLAACGPQVITGRPPFASLSGLTLTDDRLVADFGLRNRNEVSMSIDRLEIVMRVDPTEMIRYRESVDLEIAANGTETLQVVETADPQTIGMLQSLQRGEPPSLPFVLEGRVNTLEDGRLSFEQKGYLYPVPGRPGHFRSAVTHTQDLRREELF